MDMNMNLISVGVIRESVRGFETLNLTNVLFGSREIYFTSEVNSQSCSELIQQLRFLDSESRDDIKLFINSPGGEVDSGLAAVVDFVDPEKSCVYNPLDYVRYNEKTGEYRQQDVIAITNTIVSDDLLGQDAFWVNSARVVVECLICYVLEAFVPEDRNLATVLKVYKTFSGLSSSYIEKHGIPFLEDWSIIHPDSNAVRAYHLFRNNANADKTWSSINAFVTVSLKPFDFHEAQEMFNGKTTFRIENLGREKCAVFLNISDTDRSLDKLVNIFYTQVLQTLCKEADNNPDNRLKIRRAFSLMILQQTSLSPTSTRPSPSSDRTASL